MFYFYPKKLDIDVTKLDLNVYLNATDAKRKGINNGDVVVLHFKDGEIGAIAEYTDTLVEPGEIGIPFDIWDRFRFSQEEPIVVELLQQAESVKFIRKKIQGKKLTEQEAYAIVKDMVTHKLTPIEMTYFAASGYCPGFDKEELYYLTKAMVETGVILDFKDVGELVVDKHSIGGLPNKAVTPVLVPILIEMGFVVPNTFSRAITTPAGTGDVVEVLMNVSLDTKQMKRVVKEVGGMLAWGGAVNIAPADDILIQVEKPLHIESYEKFVMSIMAKKIAMGIKYLLIDIPYGRFAKVPEKDVPKVKELFEYIAKRFGIELVIYTRRSYGCDGRGVGPLLEARDVLRILERHPYRPIEVENIVLEMAALIGVLTKKYSDKYEALEEARRILETGLARERFWKIAKAQGTAVVISSESLTPSEYSETLLWEGKEGTVKEFNNRLIVEIARLLGAPADKLAGLYFEVFLGDKVSPKDKVVTLYSSAPLRIKLAKERLKGKLDKLIIVE